MRVALNVAVTMLLLGALPDRLLAVSSQPTVVVESVQLPFSGAPQSGTLDVHFNSASPDPINLAGFQLTLAIVGPNDAVKFTGASAPSDREYVFAPDSAAVLASVFASGSQLTIGDFLNSGFGHLVDGGGIASVQVSVQPAAAGKSYQVVVSLDPQESFLAADATTFLPFGVQNGAITVVPEGATATLGLLAVGTLSAARGVNLGRWRQQPR